MQLPFYDKAVGMEVNGELSLDTVKRSLTGKKDAGYTGQGHAVLEGEATTVLQQVGHQSPHHHPI